MPTNVLKEKHILCEQKNVISSACTALREISAKKKSMTITLQDTSCKLDDQADKKSALKSLKLS